MEVKWIKICTDIFDDEKIALIDSMPDSDSILVIWFKLLCMAGKQNNGGVFMLNDKIAYNDEMLATIFRRPLNVVRLALSTFENFGMVEIVDNVYTIPNWNKHQNLDKLEHEKEKTRKRVADYRQKQKLLAQSKDDENICNAYGNVTVTECNNSCNGYSNVTVTECNATDKNKIREDKNKIREDKNRILYQQIVDLFHETCVSFSKITALSDKRKKMINARLNTYGIEKITEVFKKAESSDFLKGKNNRDWKANFDWIMNDSNFAKILDGNYDNKTSQQPEKILYQDDFNHDFLEALTRKRKF